MKKGIIQMLKVTDDSGFMALIDPDAYESFVGEDWSLDQLLSHFENQMAEGRLLIWGTGMEGCWRVRVEQAGTDAEGFREIAGQITASSGRLLLTNYESLTMAAQFPDVKLPEEHQEELLIDVASGAHTCRVLQLFDADDYDAAQEDRQLDFAIEILDEQQDVPVWPTVPWSSIGDRPKKKPPWWKIW